MQVCGHFEQFFALALHHFRDRNASRATDHFGDFVHTDLGFQQTRLIGRALLGFGRFRLRQLLLQLRQFAVLDFRHFIELALALQFDHFAAQGVDLLFDVRAALRLRFFAAPDFLQLSQLFFHLGDFGFDQLQTLLRSVVGLALDCFAFNFELDQAAVEFIERLGFGVNLDFDARRGFVNQVNRFVRQKAVGDVAVGQSGRRDNRRIGDFHAVMHFVFLLQAAQNRDGGLHARLVYHDFLETALQRGVFFQRLAVFVQRGCADTVQITARQCRFEHIARINRAFGLARADHGVNLVDKHDGLTGVLLNLVQYGFQALLKIATVLRTGQQCRHVQHQNALVFQAVGHLAVDDALRQTLNDRGFTHARLTDQHRIVFAATLQNLDRAANLVVAANHRIELAAAGAFGQIQCVFFQCFTGVFCVWVVHVFPLSNAFNGGQQGLFIQAHAVQYFFQAVFALLVQQGEQ